MSGVGAIIGGAAISAAGSVAGGMMSSSAAGQAADAQSQANAQAMTIAQQQAAKASQFAQQAVNNYSAYPSQFAPYQAYGPAGQKMMGNLLGMKELITPAAQFKAQPIPKYVPPDPRIDARAAAQQAADMKQMSHADHLAANARIKQLYG